MYLEGCFDLRYLPTVATGCVGRSRGYSSAFQSAYCVSVMFRVCVLMCTGYWCRSCGSWFTCSGTVTTNFVGRKAYFN